MTGTNASLAELNLFSALLAAIDKKAEPRIIAAHDLVQRLREAGIQASARHITHPNGCAVLVNAYAPKDSILMWLDHLAVPVTPLGQCAELGIYTFDVVASGQGMALIIAEPLNHKEDLPCAMHSD
jgi:hypothetical protein